MLLAPLSHNPESSSKAQGSKPPRCDASVGLVSRLSGLFLALALLGGCATAPTAPTAAQAPESDEVAASETDQADTEDGEIEYGNFEEEELYRAIVGELEANRGNLEGAGDSYLDLALSSKDLGVIRRAVRFASLANDTNAILQLGLLWSEVDPEDPQPQLLLAIEFLDSGAFDRALPRMARVLELGGTIDFSALSSRTGQLNPQSRALLVDALQPLIDQFPDNDSLLLARVQLLAQSGEFDQALAAFEAVEDEVTATAGTVLLEAQILQNMDRFDDAIRVMRSGVRRFEQDPVLRSTLARLLISQDQLASALREYATLIEQFPQNWEARYAMAITHLELEQHGEAVEQLQALIDADQQVDESRYMMGVAFERDEQFDRAIDNYRLVSIGTNNFLAAQQQATRLSIAQGNFDDAHDWLQRVSRGQPRLEILLITLEAQLLQQAGEGERAKRLLDTSLNRFPGEVDLLFSRVLYFDSQGDLEGSERDLRSIIEIKPDDARALNHLGYMLANQTSRYDEALQLLERAIALNPGDPATTDSLAWAQYKLGRYDEALANIRRAFAAFPDPEVASHMGEILWAMGRREEALAVWERALEEAPNDPLVTEAMERLQKQGPQTDEQEDAA